jgi:superoxide dismutase, Cu-Zn family
MIRTKPVALGFVFVCASTAALAQTPQQAEATFHNQQGQVVGTATLTQTASGALMEIELSNIPEGEHGFHIHESGVCDPADGFKSAGGHFEPAQHQHGYMAADGPHAGDMPNQFAGSDGRLAANVLNSNVTISDGPTSVLDADGSAIIVHAKPDDYTSQPTGDAGDRIACAVIEKR